MDRNTEVLTTMKVWEDTKSDPKFLLGSDDERESIKQNFRDTYRFGDMAVNQYEGPRRNSLEQLGAIIKDSFSSAFTATRLADDVASENIDANTAKLLEEHSIQTQSAYQPYALGQVNETLQEMTERLDNAKGAWETIKALGHGAVGTVSEIFENPRGVLQLSAQSSGNIVPIMGASLTGAAIAGAGSGGIGTLPGAIGGALGQFLGELSTEAGHRLIEEANKELARLNLEPTEANYQAIFANEVFKDSAIKKARAKAVGTALTDTALSVVTAKIASAPIRNARKMAQKAAPVGSSAKAIEDQAAVYLKNMGTVKKFTQNLKATGFEMLSEPVSELAGQVAADDKIALGELAGEFLGGVGSSGVQTAVAKTVYGPKTLKDAKETASKRLSEARIQATYKMQVKEAVKAKDVSQYVDIDDTENYNPLVAVDALTEMNKAEDITEIEKIQNINQARDIYNLARERAIVVDNAWVAQTNSLKEKQDNDIEISEQEELEYNILSEERENIVSIYRQTEAKVKSMLEAGVTEESVKQQAQEAIKTKDSDNIVKSVSAIYGSKGGVDIDSIIDVDTAVKDTGITGEAKKLLQEVQQLEKVRKQNDENIDKTPKPGKKTEQVKHDVFLGEDDFKGIDQHLKDIAVATKMGDTGLAQKELKALNTFKNKQQFKLETFEAAASEKELTESQQELMDKLNEGKKRKYTPDSYGFKNIIIPNIQLEVNALNHASIIGESLAKSSDTVQTKTTDTTKKQTTTKPSKEEKSTANLKAQQEQTNVQETTKEESKAGQKAEGDTIEERANALFDKNISAVTKRYGEKNVGIFNKSRIANAIRNLRKAVKERDFNGIEQAERGLRESLPADINNDESMIEKDTAIDSFMAEILAELSDKDFVEYYNSMVETFRQRNRGTGDLFLTMNGVYFNQIVLEADRRGLVDAETKIIRINEELKAQQEQTNGKKQTEKVTEKKQEKEADKEVQEQSKETGIEDVLNDPDIDDVLIEMNSKFVPAKQAIETIQKEEDAYKAILDCIK